MMYLISIFFLVLTHRPFKKSTQSHYCTFLSKKCTLKIYPIITVKMYNFDGDQEDGRRHRNYGDAAQLARYAAELRVSAAVAPPVATTASSSPYGGLACTVAREEGSEIGAYGLQDESFEEQMMLAMAVSLSEARGR